MEGEVLKEQAEYWKKNLEGAPELLELPAESSTSGAAGLCRRCAAGAVEREADSRTGGAERTARDHLNI